MPRALFSKSGNAVWISHLDLMRVFQRAFKRAGLPLTHTHGFNPRPSVSIALPLSVGVESQCELLDFDLDGEPLPCDEICSRLNTTLIDGVRVLRVYENGGKIKNLALLDCEISLEYDSGIPENALYSLQKLFSAESLIVEKKSKKGVSDQNIIPMIRTISFQENGQHEVIIRCRICCQNPTLNPAQLTAAIARYAPKLNPDFARFRRLDVFDQNEIQFR